MYCSEGKDAASVVDAAGAQTATRLRTEPGWTYRELATGHDAMITMPSDLAELLLEVA